MDVYRPDGAWTPREGCRMSREGDGKTMRWRGILEGILHGWSLENRESQGCSHRASDDMTIMLYYDTSSLRRLSSYRLLYGEGLLFRLPLLSLLRSRLGEGDRDLEYERSLLLLRSGGGDLERE